MTHLFNCCSKGHIIGLKNIARLADSSNMAAQGTTYAEVLKIIPPCPRDLYPEYEKQADTSPPRGFFLPVPDRIRNFYTDRICRTENSCKRHLFVRFRTISTGFLRMDPCPTKMCLRCGALERWLGNFEDHGRTGYWHVQNSYDQSAEREICAALVAHLHEPITDSEWSGLYGTYAPTCAPWAKLEKRTNFSPSGAQPFCFSLMVNEEKDGSSGNAHGLTVPDDVVTRDDFIGWVEAELESRLSKYHFARPTLSYLPTPHRRSKINS